MTIETGYKQPSKREAKEKIGQVDLSLEKARHNLVMSMITRETAESESATIREVLENIEEKHYRDNVERITNDVYTQ